MFLAIAIVVVIYLLLFSEPRRRRSPCEMLQSKEHAEDKPEEPVPDRKFDDSVAADASHMIHRELPYKVEPNMSGLITATNTGLNSSLNTDDSKFNIKYADIISNVIGKDNIESQKKYNKYVMTDSSIRYLDTKIETDYVPFSGLSLSRLRAPNVAATGSTQIQGVDVSDYTGGSQGSLRSFI